MCNRYTPSDYEDPHFKTWLALNPTNYPPQPWSKIGPWAQGPFLANGVDRTVRPMVGQWGLIRPGNPERWDYKKPRPNAKPGAQRERLMTNNCRSESMAKARTFGASWKAGRRCIIPAVSFDEPNYETQKNVWWTFARADGKPWGVGGLWSEWTDPASGEMVPNYTMVTLNADHHSLMRRMHKPEYEPDGKTLKVPQDKRSILLIEPEDWGTWLFGTQEEALDLLKIPPPEVFDAGPTELRRLPPEGSPLRTDAPTGELF